MFVISSFFFLLLISLFLEDDTVHYFGFWNVNDTETVRVNYSMSDQLQVLCCSDAVTHNHKHTLTHHIQNTRNAHKTHHTPHTTPHNPYYAYSTHAHTTLNTCNTMQQTIHASTQFTTWQHKNYLRTSTCSSPCAEPLICGRKMCCRQRWISSRWTSRHTRVHLFALIGN